jgi:hypothetical protein
MVYESPFHILLLPRDNYWDWVEACREYAVAFSVTLTPAPQNAAMFHRPKQVISVANIPDAYPGYGDIVDWLRREVPGVRLDPLNFPYPEALKSGLSQRIETGERLGPADALVASSASPLHPPLATHRVPDSASPSAPFMLMWPTDFPEIFQEFGENPDLYRRWGLPGHEGLDFKGLLNSNIYACADGYIYLVHDGSGNHPYGIHIRIRHAEGFSTIYAHLNQALVHAGQTVLAGEPIGLAGATGNSAGGQMHLTLKKQGAYSAGLTHFPNDIVDPAPYLTLPVIRKQPPQDAIDWRFSKCLIGLHGRANGPMQEPDWQVADVARIEALMFSDEAAVSDVDRALTLNPNMLVVVGLHVDFLNRPAAVADFVHRVTPNLRRFYDHGVRYFEVHKEPNLIPEGYGTRWQSGEEFGRWFVEVIGWLKPEFPGAQFGWPGLSPGPSDGMRLDSRDFVEQAADFLNAADWIGCHCFWSAEEEIFTTRGGLGYQLYRERWPDKLVMITEFSNISPSTEPRVKADQYLRYYQHLRAIPGIGAAFAFVVSAPENYQSETWRDEGGRLKPIATAVGARTF